MLVHDHRLFERRSFLSPLADHLHGDAFGMIRAASNPTSLRYRVAQQFSCRMNRSKKETRMFRKLIVFALMFAVLFGATL